MNSEMISGSLNHKEKVRKIFTQIVNSLTAKSEIGGPMASLYILGNPDHYTGHKFVPFYWRGYVKEVLSAWDEDYAIVDLEGVEDKVVINKNQGEFVCLSKVSDYVFRPSMYEHVSLYDWIRLYHKSVKRRTRQKKVGDAVDDPDSVELSEDKLNIRPAVNKGKKEHKIVDTVDDVPLSDSIDNDIACSEPNADEEDDYDDDDDDSLDELDVMKELAEDVPKKPKKDYSFQIGHSQYATHSANMRKENPFVVPNFLPTTLPRSDRGDHEYYCCTMLTLFKPWRSGRDLKSKGESWDKSFVAHEFTKRQIEIMKYFNVRYECLDARDDYSARKDESGGLSYHWATSDVLDELDELHADELATVGAEFDPNLEGEDVEGDALSIPGKQGCCC